MKVFKTILRTTLFWLLALVGLRIYTSYESENSNLVHYRASALPKIRRTQIVTRDLLFLFGKFISTIIQG